MIFCRINQAYAENKDTANHRRNRSHVEGIPWHDDGTKQPADLCRKGNSTRAGGTRSSASFHRNNPECQGIDKNFGSAICLSLHFQRSEYRLPTFKR